MMASIENIVFENQTRPIAVSRSSIKMVKASNVNATYHKTSSSSTFLDPSHQHCDIEPQPGNQPAPSANQVSTKPAHDKPIKLFVSADETNDMRDPNNADLELDTDLSALFAEYRASLNKRDCVNASCYHFKLLSFKISQILLERINALKTEHQLTKVNKSDKGSRSEANCDSDGPSSIKHLLSMDKDELTGVVIRKDRRINELERLVEDHRRLRLQDASQVEEKAARIKEWVASKLKELENQNRQLREQNRKQKQAIESSRTKLAALSAISSAQKSRASSDSIHYIDQSSPLNSIVLDSNPQTCNAQPAPLSPPNGPKQNLQITLKSTPQASDNTNTEVVVVTSSKTGHEKDMSVSGNSFSGFARQESPIYDSVTMEQPQEYRGSRGGITRFRGSVNDNHNGSDETRPPPPPSHKFDSWELHLYRLADETFSAIMNQSSEEGWSEFNQPDSIDSNFENDASRKSSTSSKNDLISLVKPSFRTIDGDQVFESLECEAKPKEQFLVDGSERLELKIVRNDRSDSININDQMSVKSKELCKNSPEFQGNVTPNLFDSPMRSKLGKENILRTQSVRRPPAPEKLYHFMSADLIRRGYLVKPGALKSHSRWFVLKNFQLCSYKSESDETINSEPNLKIKIDAKCLVNPMNQIGDSNFPFKIISHDKTLQLSAESAKSRDEWIRILTIAINLSDIEPSKLTKDRSSHEGLLSFTRHGHTKRCYAILVDHVVFFLKSITDPTPVSYLSVKGSRITEFTDNHDYDFEEQEIIRQTSSNQDCSLAIYPKFSMTQDPVYITLGSQQETDKWFHFLSLASGLDQSYGTRFERALTKHMLSISLKTTPKRTISYENGPRCLWRECTEVVYSDKPITEPLTSLPNETLRVEAVELFKSVLLFTQVPLEPVAIDYHVSLLQNCLARLLKFPELRNEFFAQLVKQCTYISHRCESKPPNLGSSHSPTGRRSSWMSDSSNECQFVTDVRLLSPTVEDYSAASSQSEWQREKIETDKMNNLSLPSQGEQLQVMQILAIAVSLNLPRGRVRWWMVDLLTKFANPDTHIGKYALHTLRAIDRTVANGSRDNIPSRMEIMSILMRNPYDHSNPHSLPINFSDGSYLVVEADGSTTVEEFMSSMARSIDVRHSTLSDFYLFADDPLGSNDMHILEPQRKVMDVVGWWEQAFRRQNSGRYQNTRAIKITCKKRLVLRAEAEETEQEKLLIVHQLHRQIASQKIPMKDMLALELESLMAQLILGNQSSVNGDKPITAMLEQILLISPTGGSSHDESRQNQIIERWKTLNGRSNQDCVRIYLNCIRRLELSSINVT